jgi:hypothetical protein
LREVPYRVISDQFSLRFALKFASFRVLVIFLNIGTANITNFASNGALNSNSSQQRRKTQMSHKGQHSHNYKQIEAYTLFAQAPDTEKGEVRPKKSHHKHKHHKNRRSSTGDLAADVPSQTVNSNSKGSKDLAQSIPGQVLGWKRKQKKKYVYDCSCSSSDEGSSGEKPTN